MNRRSFFGSVAGVLSAGTIALADFTLPDAVLEKPKPSVVVNGVRYEFRYRDRRSDWSWPGRSLRSLQRHILEHPNHRGTINVEWVLGLPFEHLKALHSDHHENRVNWGNRKKSKTACPT